MIAGKSAVLHQEHVRHIHLLVVQISINQFPFGQNTVLKLELYSRLLLLDNLEQVEFVWRPLFGFNKPLKVIPAITSSSIC